MDYKEFSSNNSAYTRHRQLCSLITEHLIYSPSKSFLKLKSNLKIPRKLLVYPLMMPCIYFIEK